MKTLSNSWKRIHRGGTGWALATSLVALMAACGERAPVMAVPLEDGVYEVVGSAAKVASLPSSQEGTRVLLFDRRFIQAGDSLPPEHVLIRVRDFAPLDLSQPPRVADADGSPRLLLNLRPAAAKALTALTTRTQHAAIVIGGEIVTVHSIQVPIEGGGLEVSC